MEIRNKNIKCRILGTAPGKPVLGRHQSALWFGISDKSILIDSGEGVSQQVLKYGLDGDHLDTVVISHYHPDHVSGLFLLIQLLYLQRREKSLNVYLPERTEEFEQIMKFFYLFQERLTYQIYFQDMGMLADRHPQIEIIKNKHLSGYQNIINKNKLGNEMASYSFLIAEGEKKILYTADFASDLSQLVPDVDYSIIDGIHPPAKHCIEIIAKTKIKAIITHGMSNALKKELKELPPERYIIAEDGYLLGD